MSIEDAVARLSAGLAEDERIAQAALGNGHVHDECDSERCVHDRRHDPARTLRQVEAIRKVLDEHPRTKAGYCATCTDLDYSGGLRPMQWPCPTLRILASIYTEEERT